LWNWVVQESKKIIIFSSLASTRVDFDVVGGGVDNGSDICGIGGIGGKIVGKTSSPLTFFFCCFAYPVTRIIS
jgi:hypothetical protein